MIVVEKGNKIVGSGAIIGDHIYRVFVDPRVQGRGVGKAIMNHLEAKAVRDGLTQVILDVSLPSRRFYQHLGYEFFEEVSRDVGDGQTLDFFKARKRWSPEGS